MYVIKVLVVMLMGINVVTDVTFIEWEGLWCPCCGYKLRTKPRHSKFKAKLRIEKQKQNHMQKAQNKNGSNILLHLQ
jgi:DNA-directed RNA polymerase subunit RPC12/RpoP